MTLEGGTGLQGVSSNLNIVKTKKGKRTRVILLISIAEMSNWLKKI